MHILGQVALFDLPLGIHGGHLPVGGLLGRPLGRRRQRSTGPALQRPVQQGGEDAVDHQVGIAADGRGEVAVKFCRQTEVPQILRVVPGLPQAAQHHHVDGGGLRGVPGLLQHLLEGEVVGLAQVVAQGGEHAPQGGDLVLRGLFVDPVHRRGVKLEEVLGHALVGREHKRLNEGLGDPRLPDLDVHRVPLPVTDHTALPALQIQRAPEPAALLQSGGQGRHVPEHGQDVGIFGLQLRVQPGQQGVAVAVGHALGGADDGLDEPVVQNRPIRPYGQDAAQGQPVHVGVQGTDAVGQLRGQHGHHLVGKVDRSAPVPRLQVQRRALGHVVGHVRDVDPQHPAAPRVPLQGDGVIEVLGRGSVDGDDRLVPQVQAAGQGGGLHLPGRQFGGGLD